MIYLQNLLIVHFCVLLHTTYYFILSHHHNIILKCLEISVI